MPAIGQKTVLRLVILKDGKDVPQTAVCGKGMLFETVRAFTECVKHKSDIVVPLHIEDVFEKHWEALSAISAVSEDREFAQMLGSMLKQAYDAGVEAGEKDKT